MKVNDIRPDDVVLGQAAALQHDIDWLSARRHEFVTVACPSCASTRSRALYEKYAMTHQSCEECGTQYICPRPSAAMLKDFYVQSKNYEYWAKYIFPASREQRREAIFKPRAAIVAEALRESGISGGLLVEIGAAQGLFCDEIRKLGLFDRIVAVEPTPDLAAECRRLGFETIEAPWENLQLKERAHVIASFEVIEHLFDPGAFVRWCAETLTEGGHLLLTCPNIAGFETLALGQASDSIDHEHINLFTPDSLRRLIEGAGFDVVRSSTPGELDVEIVQRALESGRVDSASLGPVVARLVRNPDPAVTKALQDLLKTAHLSSHMMFLARRRRLAGTR